MAGGMETSVTRCVEYCAGEKLLQISQISKKVYPLRFSYCVRVYILDYTNLGFAILLLRIDQPSQSSQNV